MTQKIVTICGSMKVVDRMIAIGQDLENRGFVVLLPNLGEVNDYLSLSEAEQVFHKNRMIISHLRKLKKADVVLVVNERLNDIDGYVGANSFLEMGIAFAFGKKICLLNSIPEQSNMIEIMGLGPIVLQGDLQGL